MIYFAKAKGSESVRIGTSLNVKQRISSLQVTMMRPVTAVAVIHGRNAEESFLHHCFAPVRERHDWFLDCDAIRCTVEQAKSGAIAWIPHGTFVVNAELRREALCFFGSVERCQTALGYSRRKTLEQMFTDGMITFGGVSRFRFYQAWKARELPDSILALHPNAPVYHMQSRHQPTPIGVDA